MRINNRLDWIKSYELWFKISYQIVIGMLCLFTTYSYGQQKKDIHLEGIIKDEFDMTVPYAAIGIPSKYIGTSSNDDGGFQLSLYKSNLTDSLEVSSIGYETFKIKVQDYLKQKQKVIILKEDIVSLSEVKILKPYTYAKNAIKKLKSTTLSSKHQINMIYRRSSNELGKTRFLVEHYLKIFDYGLVSPSFEGIEIAEQRKSADYRFAFRKQPAHSVNVMAMVNPIRQGINLNDYNWSKTGDTSYDGEDIVIIEGREKARPKWFVKFYIGIDTYGIYKMEMYRLSAVYIYKKDLNGKLVLSYHSREAKLLMPLSAEKAKLLKIKTKNGKIRVSYRQEAIVLSVISDKKKFDIENLLYERKDNGDYDIKYNPIFWDTINLPPETKFYKKSVRELESIYGVPLERQFEAVNK